MTELKTLVENLRHPDKNVRGPAAVALGSHDTAAARDALLAAVGHEPDFFVREDITWALVRMGESALQPLMALLGDDSPAVRHHAAHTLGKIGDRRAVGALLNALADTESAVVSKTVFTLGQLGDVGAIPSLVGLLAHPDREVQAQLVTALERFGAAAVPFVTDALHDPHPQVRELAADVLGVIGERSSVGVVADLLNDEHWRVRFAAATALGHLGGTAAHNAIREHSSDPDRRVQQLIATILKRTRA